MADESKLERKCADYAYYKLGILNYKFGGGVGNPDRIFLHNGQTLFVEFKAQGKLPTQIQVHTQLRLVKRGFTVLNVDDYLYFTLKINRWLKGVENGNTQKV